MTPDVRTRSVLVIGDGIAGLAAAIALHRALPGAQVKLVMLALGDGVWINRLGAAPPLLARFHRQIGLEAALFHRRCSANAVRLRHYLTHGRSTVREACTSAIPFVEGVPLHQLWLRSIASEPFATPDFAALLLQLREANEEEGGFGTRYDAIAYQALLTEMAAALGIERVDVAHIDIDVNDATVRAIVTDGGVRLQADLYVDTAGPHSRLLEATGVGWVDWSHFLPAMALSVDQRRHTTAAEEIIESRVDGVSWQTTAWTAFLAPDETAAPSGRMACFWHRNVVAIGDAAAHVPVIDGAKFGRALEDILRIIALLARPGSSERAQQEYERRTMIAYESLLAWTSLSAAQVDAARPASLASILDAFAARGRVATIELDPTTPGEWLARLMTLGPKPQRIDPTAWALPEDIVRSTIARART